MKRYTPDDVNAILHVTCPAVLGHWIRRYGEPARAIIKRHGQYSDELDSPPAGSDPAPETSD